MKWITDLSVHLNELCVHMSRSKGLQMLVHNPRMLVNIHISKKKKSDGSERRVYHRTCSDRIPCGRSDI